MIDRSAFLYMEGEGHDFAQCSTCRFWIERRDRCVLHADSVRIPGSASCGLYVHGQPEKNGRGGGFVTPHESGLVNRQVRCENCKYFSGNQCGLYKELNKQRNFKLDTFVSPTGCCNAQEQK